MVVIRSTTITQFLKIFLKKIHFDVIFPKIQGVFHRIFFKYVFSVKWQKIATNKITALDSGVLAFMGNIFKVTMMRRFWMESRL